MAFTVLKPNPDTDQAPPLLSAGMISPAMLTPVAGNAPPPTEMARLPQGSVEDTFRAKPPNVQLTSNPLEQMEGNAQNRLQRAMIRDGGPLHRSTMGKIAHVLSVAGNIAGDIFAPGVMANIPGTQMHNQIEESNLRDQIAGIEKQKSEQALQGAQTSHLAGETEAMKPTPMTAEEAAAAGNPGLEGMPFNAAQRQALLKQGGINKTKVDTTTQTNQTKRDIADAAALSREKIASLKPEQRDDRAIRLMEKPPEQRTQEENAYLGAYSKWVDQTKTQPGVQRMMALAQFRPAKITDENGDVHYDYMGHAIQTGAKTPESMNFRTAVKMATFMTSGKGGSTLTAYRTAGDHLDLLESAMTALENGDNQTLNSLSNRFKAEFGSPAPTNFETIKTMLSGELANVAKVTGATDPEIASYRQQLSAAQSPEQIQGIIDTNHALMDQKAIEMMRQNEAGMQGKPEFGKGAGGTGGGVGTTTYKDTATGAGGHKIGSNDGGETWYDVQTGKKVQ